MRFQHLHLFLTMFFFSATSQDKMPADKPRVIKGWHLYGKYSMWQTQVDDGPVFCYETPYKEAFYSATVGVWGVGTYTIARAFGSGVRKFVFRK